MNIAPELQQETREYHTSFDHLSHSELVNICIQLTQENQKYKELLNQRKEINRRTIDSNISANKLEFGSYGSSSVMFLKAADDSVGNTSDIAVYERCKTDTDAVQRDYLALQRGEGAFKAPDVSDYRNLFKKSVVLQYEADSPAFRKKIESMDKNVEDLRSHLQLLVDKCRSYCKNGNAFVDSGKDFASLMSQLQEPVWAGRLGEGLSEFLAKFGNAFEMIESYREAVIVSLETTFSAPMEEFVKLEAKSVRKLKNAVSQNSEVYESALAKFLSLKTSVDDEVVHRKEAELATMRKELELSRYDLVTELNSLETKKKFQLCERTCSALYIYLGFFHQCHTMVATMEPAMRQLTSEMSRARDDFRREAILREAKRIQLKNDLEKDKKKDTKNRSLIAAAASKSKVKVRNSLNMAAVFTRELGKSHQAPTSTLSTIGEDLESEMARDDEVGKAGFLWKKTSNMMKEWKRRWFFIQNGKLYYARTDNLSDSPPTLVCDLLISTVRENCSSDMRFTFEVISPGQRIYILQGESEKDTNEWVQAIREQIEKQLALQIAPGSSRDVSKDDDDDDMNMKANEIDELHKVNQRCADCGAQFPSWASLNLCIMICIECSGIHRSLGTHISKVRSISLDKWSPNNKQLLLRVGNIRSNLIWEEMIQKQSDEKAQGDPHKMHPSKIVPNSSRQEKEKFIYAKYVERRYISEKPPQETANEMLFQASLIGDLVDMMRAIAYGANVNWRNEQDDFKSPLHVACHGGHVLGVELLCQSNANVDAVDSHGKTPLDYSAEMSDNIIESLVRKLERDLDYQIQSAGDRILRYADEDRQDANDDPETEMVS
mmetsp:Transcript_20948/g.30198  ORF Transcript_20948/g.30198 Transcript_20948/m.30198 type:complete len:833 (+) Transcript_20948:91-2589(+)